MVWGVEGWGRYRGYVLYTQAWVGSIRCLEINARLKSAAMCSAKSGQVKMRHNLVGNIFNGS